MNLVGSILLLSIIVYDCLVVSANSNFFPNTRSNTRRIKRIPYCIIHPRGGGDTSNDNDYETATEELPISDIPPYYEPHDIQQQEQEQLSPPPPFVNQQQQLYVGDPRQQGQHQQYDYDNNIQQSAVDPYYQQQQQQQRNQYPNTNNGPYGQQQSPQNQDQFYRRPPPQQQQQRQQQQQKQLPPPDVYPIPPQQQRQQQQQQVPPPPMLPGGDYDFSEANEDDVPPFEVVPWDPAVPEQQQQQQQQNPDVIRGPDLSTFNKEYIQRGLARLYRKKILPIEVSSRYGHFHSPPLSPSDFDAPPMILLLGQYSVGKTSFVKYLLGRDFPGIRVGPEPTTDRFTAILWGPQDKVIPGAALCSQMDRPFTGLNPFGNNFLSRMEAVELNAPILRNITIIDTPGILSGQKQKSRNYDYEAVMKWFAERADLIIVMFDAHKLDISDELKGVMHLLIPHLDKIRIVLNKADTISTQQLLRVYGALMWSLGKVMNTPEVSRVYVGSFWDAPLQNTEQIDLLQREELDLLTDIMTLPQHAIMRRINELVKRARSVKVHAYIIHYLRKQLPYNPWMKREKQMKLIRRLESEFTAAARRYGLPKGDFPPVEVMRNALMEIKDLSEFPKLDKKLIREMDKVFSTDIPELLERAKQQ